MDKDIPERESSPAINIAVQSDRKPFPVLLKSGQFKPNELESSKKFRIR